MKRTQTFLTLLSMLIQIFYPFLLFDATRIYASSESDQTIQELTEEEVEEENSSEEAVDNEEEKSEEVIDDAKPEAEEENVEDKTHEVIVIESEEVTDKETEFVLEESTEVTQEEEIKDEDNKQAIIPQPEEPSPTTIEEEVEKESEPKSEEKEDTNEESETKIWIENEDGSVTTANEVKTDFEYIYKDSNLKLVFTQISQSGTLTIREVELSDEELNKIDAISNKAYEITSTLENGTFKYNLTLPIPQDKSDEDLEVTFFEDMDSIDDAEAFDTDPELSEDTITIKDIDHFTVIAVTISEEIVETTTPPFPTKEECLATDDRKITICHATSSEENPYNQLTISCNAVYSPGEGGHLEENGTPKAGHEDDMMPDENGYCPGDEPETVEITGHKYDDEGTPIQAWQINLCKFVDDDINNECETIGFQITNDQGEYTFEDLEIGVYKVTEETDPDYFMMYPASGSYIVDFINSVYWPVGNLVMNGGFEYPVVGNEKKWDISPSGTSGLGWNVIWEGGSSSFGGAIRPANANLELHAGVSGWSPKEGLQYAELDTDWDGPSGLLNKEPASVRIQQEILSCENAEFDLLYDWSARPNHSDNKLEVYWNGSEVGDHSASGSSNPDWNHVELNELSASGSFTLEFVEKGEADSLGMFLDDVQVIQKNKCDLGELNFYNEPKPKDDEPENGSLLVCKFEDTNGDTRYNAENEKLLDGWNIRLDEGDWNETIDGCVIYSDLLPGSYSVEEEMQDGWSNTTDNPAEVKVSSGEQTTYYIGNKKIDTGLIKGYKFEDININGVWDEGEPALPNWKINVGDTEYLTDSNGYYEAEVSPETYMVTESIEDGWYQTAPGEENKYGCLIEIAAGEEKECDFGNYKGGQIQGKKYQDNNINGSFESESETFLNGWTIRLYDSEWELVDTEITPTTNNQGEYLFASLEVGNYYTCEVIQEGWTQTGPILGDGLIGNGIAVQNLSSATDEAPVCWVSSIDQSSQERSSLLFGNVELSNIQGYKWNDLNQNGKRDICQEEEYYEQLFNQDEVCEEEPLLPEWKIFIDENSNNIHDDGEPVDFTNTDGENYGWYSFEGLLPGEYKICEELISGWTQTYPSDVNCHVVTLPNYGEDYEPMYNFGNNFTEPTLQIAKFNSVNDGAIVSSRGGSVLYTIQITALENNIKDVVVTDLPPGGFKYRLGSWTASSSVRGNIKSSNITTEPTYASPGDWKLGDMEENEVVTLTYIADIDESQDPGIYKDLAWGVGTSEVGGPVLAEAQPTGFIDDNFVGTKAKIIVENDSPSDDVEVEEVEEEVEVEEEGSVLGASTYLPATGANTSLIYLSLFLLFVGLLSITSGVVIRYSKKILLNKKVFGILFALLFFALGVVDAEAASDTVNVRIQDLENLVNSSFSINYVAMDLDGEEITITCYYAKGISSNPSISFETATLKSGGNSGFCNVGNSILTSNGDYSFKVVAKTSDGDVSESEVVTTKYDSDGPDKPKDLKVDDKGGCKYDIEFKTANDGETAYVEVYRSTSKEIEAKTSSRVKTVNIGPDKKYEYTDTISTGDCDKDYYYAIRAFDNVGNASDVVAQEDIKIVVKTISSSSSSESNQGLAEGASTSSAIIVTEGTSTVGAPGTTDNEDNQLEEIDEANVGEETQEGDGSVLGTEDEDNGEIDEGDSVAEEDFVNKSNPKWWWIILLPLIGGVFYFVKTRKK